MERIKNKKHKGFLSIGIFLLLVILIWAGFVVMPAAARVDLPKHDGVLSIPISSCRETMYRSNKPNWVSWPEKLYTSQDFTSGVVDIAPVSADDIDYTETQYVTHQMRLALMPNKSYGFSLISSHYSMRFFIDDEQIDLVGLPGESRKPPSPRVGASVLLYPADR